MRLKAAATAAVAVVVTLLALEGLGRLFLPDPLRRLDPERELFLRPSSDPDVRYELTPGASGHAWATDVTVNSQGFRGPEVAPGKSAKYRIIAIGDSVTFGNGLPPETSYPHQLQRLLTDEGAPGYDVLNFGVGGYDTIQEVAALELRGTVFHPDLVIVGYCLNDIGVASINLGYFETMQELRQRWFYRSLVLRYIRYRFAGRDLWKWQATQNEVPVFTREYRNRIDAIPEDDTALRALMKSVRPGLVSSAYASEPKVGRLRHAFGWLQRLAAREHFKVVVVIIPFLDWTATAYSHAPAHAIVTYEANRAGFDVLDSRELLARHTSKDLQDYPGDIVHPNATGHQIIAAALRDYVRASRH